MMWSVPLPLCHRIGAAVGGKSGPTIYQQIPSSSSYWFHLLSRRIVRKASEKLVGSIYHPIPMDGAVHVSRGIHHPINPDFPRHNYPFMLFTSHMLSIHLDK